jgi:hypothetical protein
MGERRKPEGARENAAEQQMRDQEVLRANRELAAYFRGRRTEREARAALRIIKAFLRERERQEAGSRRPLPGTAARLTPRDVQPGAKRKVAGDHAERRRRKVRPGLRDEGAKPVPASPEPDVGQESPTAPASDDQSRE